MPWLPPLLGIQIAPQWTVLEAPVQMVSECAAQAGKLQFLLTRKEFKGQITQAATIRFDCLTGLWPAYQMCDLPTDLQFCFILKALRPYFGVPLCFSKLELSKGVCLCPLLSLHGVLCGPALTISCHCNFSLASLSGRETRSCVDWPLLTVCGPILYVSRSGSYNEEELIMYS